MKRKFLEGKKPPSKKIKVDKLDRFRKWLCDNGAKLDNVKLHFISKEIGFGVTILKPMEYGKAVVSIPPKLIMDWKKAIAQFPELKKLEIVKKHSKFLL